jgi:hypothetical protein
MTLRASFTIVTLLLGSACGSTGGTTNAKSDNSSAAIRAAEEVGATHNPDAKLHLQLAKEQFEHAQALAGKDKEAADRLLLRAQADAELSLALARSESEKADALGAIEKVNTLKKSATP